MVFFRKITTYIAQRRTRFALAGAAGFLLTLAFPKWNIAGAAWVAPALILVSAVGEKGKDAFWIGFAAGFVHFLTSLAWLLNIPYTFHGIPIGPGAGWLALSAYSGLFMGFWAWICWKIAPQDLKSEKAPRKQAFLLQKLSWTEKSLWCLGCALAWVAVELTRAHFLTGFPWNLLGNSQYKLLPLIQIASIGGVYAVSFLIVWVSISIALAMVGLFGKPLTQGEILPGERLPLPAPQTPLTHFQPLRDVFLPLLALAGVIAFGAEKVISKTPAQNEVKVALIQPSIPQTVIWDPSGDEARFDRVMDLSKKALASKPDVLIWPESALPGFTEKTFTALTNLVVQNGVWMILCADDADPPIAKGEPVRYYNSSFLISPKGEVVNTYRKRRLVIFGEYIPLVKWLPFLRMVTPIGDGFTPGPGPVEFRLGDTQAKVSPLICFEDVFPHEARDHAGPETDFLLNLTNDGWFGEGSCQWQQAASGVFRAVENGVPLVRCTNNGITCWIDGWGRIQKVGPDSIYGPGYLLASIPLRDTHSQTYYTLHGDTFAWGATFLTLLMLGRRSWETRKSKIKHA